MISFQALIKLVTSVHLLLCFLRHFRLLKIDVRRPRPDPTLGSLRGQIDAFDGAEESEDFCDVFLRHVSRQVSHVNLRRLRSWGALATAARC